MPPNPKFKPPVITPPSSTENSQSSNQGEEAPPSKNKNSPTSDVPGLEPDLKKQKSDSPSSEVCTAGLECEDQVEIQKDTKLLSMGGQSSSRIQDKNQVTSKSEKKSSGNKTESLKNKESVNKSKPSADKKKQVGKSLTDEEYARIFNAVLAGGNLSSALLNESKDLFSPSDLEDFEDEDDTFDKAEKSATPSSNDIPKKNDVQIFVPESPDKENRPQNKEVTLSSQKLAKPEDEENFFIPCSQPLRTTQTPTTTPVLNTAFTASLSSTTFLAAFSSLNQDSTHNSLVDSVGPLSSRNSVVDSVIPSLNRYSLGDEIEPPSSQNSLDNVIVPSSTQISLADGVESLSSQKPSDDGMPLASHNPGTGSASRKPGSWKSVATLFDSPIIPPVIFESSKSAARPEAGCTHKQTNSLIFQECSDSVKIPTTSTESFKPDSGKSEPVKLLSSSSVQSENIQSSNTNGALEKTSQSAKCQSNPLCSASSNSQSNDKPSAPFKTSSLNTDQESQASCSNNSLSQCLSQQYILSQPPSQITPKERLLWLQKRRVTGLWVQCDHKMCGKWRYLPDCHDPTTLPDKWFCNMHPDDNFNSCDAPEKRLSLLAEEDMIFNKFSPGCLVWAHLTGYPWWPAMIDDDPDLEQFYWLNGFSDIPSWYHVVFLDDKPKRITRAWIETDKLKIFRGLEESPNVEIQRDDYKKRVTAAGKLASNGLNLPLLDRLRQFSFISQFKGPIGKKLTPMRARIESESEDSEEQDEDDDISFAKLQRKDNSRSVSKLKKK